MKISFFNHFAPLVPVALLTLTLALSGCNEYLSVPEPGGFSDEILNIIPQSKIDSLRSLGIPIYEGRTPPEVLGSYFVNPYVLVVPWSDNDNYYIGRSIGSYTYTFYNFDTQNNTLRVDFKSSTGSESGTGLGGIVSGKDSSFTIFIELKGVSGGVENTTVTVLAGKISPDGIFDFYNAFYLKEKSEGSGLGTLIPVGTGRVWKDEDGFSEKI
ncbi:MAG: hypothetical protein NWR72_09250 [Bacteroidia bacterium]|nr:hypothetical protein [Bacteroidia bacterium]